MSEAKIIAKDIYWDFSVFPQFDTQEDFIKQLKEYVNEVSFYNKLPNFDEIAIENGEVLLQYMKWDEEEDDYDEIRIKITSDNNTNFSMGELLYKMHNSICEDLVDDERCFFEGLMYGGEDNMEDDDSDEPKMPLYFVLTGS